MSVIGNLANQRCLLRAPMQRYHGESGPSLVAVA